MEWEMMVMDVTQLIEIISSFCRWDLVLHAAFRTFSSRLQLRLLQQQTKSFRNNFKYNFLTRHLSEFC
jgi:hypothetical protein